MKELFDPIRNKWVLAFPEEKVRQKLLIHMVEKLGYPRSLLCVEKDIHQLIFTKKDKKGCPKRRIDILCYGYDIHPEFSPYPLLMIECKAHKLSDDVIEQVIGYNYYVGAYFVSIANQKEIQTYWWNEKEKKYSHVFFLPSYRQLVEAVSLS